MTGKLTFSGSPSPADALTPRERDILLLMADDLSNAEIAERLVIAPGTIKWYVKQIYSKLDVHSREEAITYAVELVDATSEPHADQPATNLPALTTPLIGRRQEIQALSQMLQRDSVRLITLIGTPGIGKTRLSLEVAQRSIGQFPDGVTFVPLAPISDPDLVSSAVVKALGIQNAEQQSSTDTLKDYLRRKRHLLVLDNFEHILEAATLVSDLLSEAPGVKIVVTSREPLRVYGEQEYPVPTLSLPDSREDQSQLATCEAVTLFVQRAQAVKPDFELTSDNLAIIADICARLDALPLAIELSAARVKLLTPRALLDRLEQRLSALTGGARDLPERHQTLRAAIAWSHDLLSEGEQRLFRRMAVFAGGWTLDALEAITTDPTLDPLQIDVFDGLELLVNKSLVQQGQSETGDPRFYMLETIREYALEKLHDSGETNAVSRAHAQYYLAQTGELANVVRTAGETRAVSKFESDYDNFRAAWLYAVDQRDEALLALASDRTYRFYIRWRWMHDGIFLYQAALQSLQNHGTLLEADLRFGYVQLRSVVSDADGLSFEADIQRALDIFGRHDQFRRMVAPIIALAWVEMKRGQPDTTRQMLEEAFRLAQASGDQSSIISVRLSQALLDYELKHFEETKVQLQALLEVVRSERIHSLHSLLLHNLWVTAVQLGDFEHAKKTGEQFAEVVQNARLYRLFAEADRKLGYMAFIGGDIDAARQHSELAVKHAYTSGENIQIVDSQFFFGIVAAHTGDLELAQAALRSVLPLVETDDEKRHAIAAAVYLAAALGQDVSALTFIGAMAHDNNFARELYYLLEPLRRELESRMSAEAYQAAWEAGTQMTLEAAFDQIRF